MNVLDWLMSGDAAIRRLTSKYLLDTPAPYEETGYIQRYLALFDPKTGLWGGGVYGPKWISTHYTMLELKYMGLNPENAAYHTGLSHIIAHEWRTPEMDSPRDGLDVCVLGMVIGLAIYGRSNDIRIFEMVDYLLEHQMPDGGWNCSWDSTRRPSRKSSLHSTLTILEAFDLYLTLGYTHQSDTVKTMVTDAEAFILKKNLFRAVRTGEIINPDFIKFHYPERWKYDAFRALDYFATAGRPYDARMQEAIDLVIKGMQKGFISKGSQYSGKLHFQLETSKAGRFNTLRALKILKAYAPDVYMDLILNESRIDYSTL